MREMQFDFDGLIQLLAGHLYSDKQVFLRELIQNAQDSIRRRQAKDPAALPGRIHVRANPSELICEVQDNGDGMTDADLHEFLSTIGKSGTRLQKPQIAGLVGQFGIGFLAAFLVGKRVEVLTRHYDSPQGWRWVNEGRKSYELSPYPVADAGTTVRVFLKGVEERGLIREEELCLLIKKYADMLPTPIFLNEGPNPVNLQVMPWEQTSLTDSERRNACHLFLEEKMPDHILEVIPFHATQDLQADGVLYLTKTRTLGIDIPRSVRLYLHRMFLSDNAPDLLPQWATFVNGVINAHDLAPTAARDTYVRDRAAERLREALGLVVLQYLTRLQSEDPERFRMIQAYHSIGIKSACFYHQELFEKFAPLLLWRTNGRAEEREPGLRHMWKTLPELLAHVPKDGEGVHVLSCFTNQNAANQYFQMADASNTIVIDASFGFEGDLLTAYAQLPGMRLRLVHVDREEDPTIFKTLTRGQDECVHRLAEVMTSVVQPNGQQLRVEARRFEPAELAAVLRTTERSEATRRARAMLADPTFSPELREVAHDLLRMSRDAALKLVINAANPLVQRLARQDLTRSGMGILLVGLYHSAVIQNAHLLTTDNARHLHAHMERLMGLALTKIEQVETLRARVGECDTVPAGRP